MLSSASPWLKKFFRHLSSGVILASSHSSTSLQVIQQTRFMIIDESKVSNLQRENKSSMVFVPFFNIVL